MAFFKKDEEEPKKHIGDKYSALGDRLLLEQFENELNGRTFDQYCFDQGYRIPRPLMAGTHKVMDYFVNSETIPIYEDVSEKWKALCKLRWLRGK